MDFCNNFVISQWISSYSHTMLLWLRPLHWYATLWPSNGRVFIVLRNIHLCWKIRRKIKKSGLNAGSAFPSCSNKFYQLKTLFIGDFWCYLHVLELVCLECLPFSNKVSSANNIIPSTIYCLQWNHSKLYSLYTKHSLSIVKNQHFHIKKIVIPNSL